MQRNAKEASRVSLGATVGSSWPWAQECSPLLGTNASFRFQSSLALKFWICNGVSREPKVCLTSMAHRIVKKKKPPSFSAYEISGCCLIPVFFIPLQAYFTSCFDPGAFWGKSGNVAKSQQDRCCNFLQGQWQRARGGEGGWLLHPQATAEVSPIAQRPYRSQISSLCSK